MLFPPHQANKLGTVKDVISLNVISLRTSKQPQLETSLAFGRTTRDSSGCDCVCTGEAFFLLDGQLNLCVTHTLLSARQETDSKKLRLISLLMLLSGRTLKIEDNNMHEGLSKGRRMNGSDAPHNTSPPPSAQLFNVGVSLHSISD